jgi:hypothetical protein
MTCIVDKEVTNPRFMVNPAGQEVLVLCYDGDGCPVARFVLPRDRFLVRLQASRLVSR